MPTLALLSSILLSSAAQLLMKASMLNLSDNSTTSAIANSLFDGKVFLLALIGLVCYALSTLSWIKALSFFDLSFAYPMLAISYVVVYFVAILSSSFAEQFNTQRAIGLSLILGGTLLVSHSTKK